MVGFVIISHSKKLAEGIVDLTRMMAPDARIAAAGGLEDGSFGTSYEKIQSAIREVYSDEGVILLMDMGSAVMTAEMVLESMGSETQDPEAWNQKKQNPERMTDLNIRMADCPIAEGAVVGTVQAVSGASMEEILAELATLGATPKIAH